MCPTEDAKAALILDTVASVIEHDGHDAVELREIARRARVSLRTIYKHFPSRDTLLLAAAERWMQQRVYQPVAAPDPDAPLADRVTVLLGELFQPWLANPRMLQAFVQARQFPGGTALGVAGYVAMMKECFGKDADSEDATEVITIVSHVVHSVMVHHASGTMPAEAVLPTLGLTVARLLSDRPVPAMGAR